MGSLGLVTRQTDTSQLRLTSEQVAQPRVSLLETVTRARCWTMTPLKCWGGNTKGQLRVGDQTDRSSPIGVDLGAGHTAKSVSAGGRHTCAVLDDDSLKCWGNNAHCYNTQCGGGQLGVGDTTDRYVPTAVDLGAGRTKPRVSLLENCTRAQCLTMTLLSAGDIVLVPASGLVDTNPTNTSQLRLTSSRSHSQECLCWRQSHVRGAGR